MSTAHKNPDQIEHFEDIAVVKQKATQLAQWIRQARHFIIFTGAGISTSTGIPDFRGPQGIWTLRAQGKNVQRNHMLTMRAIPSLAHMSIVELMRRGICKFLITQNTDGLHRRSGVPIDKLAELHGNSNLERCERCHKEYLRDFVARANNPDVHDHHTGRTCDNPQCGGRLVDSVIHFGEPLPRNALEDGFDQAEKADLSLLLGSSLTVSPACNMPSSLIGRRGKKLVICNLQKTPLDRGAALVIHARTDDLMCFVMEALGIEVPPFVLQRRAIIGNTLAGANNNPSIYLKGVDVDGTPVSFITKLDMITRLGGRDQEELAMSLGGTTETTTIGVIQSAKSEFCFPIATAAAGAAAAASSRGGSMMAPSSLPSTVRLRMHFRGFYGETPLEVEYKPDWSKDNAYARLLMCWTPAEQKWETVLEEATEVSSISA